MQSPYIFPNPAIALLSNADVIQQLPYKINSASPHLLSLLSPRLFFYYYLFPPLKRGQLHGRRQRRRLDNTTELLLWCPQGIVLSDWPMKTKGWSRAAGNLSHSSLTPFWYPKELQTLTSALRYKELTGRLAGHATHKKNLSRLSCSAQGVLYFSPKYCGLLVYTIWAQNALDFFLNPVFLYCKCFHSFIMPFFWVKGFPLQPASISRKCNILTF